MREKEFDQWFKNWQEIAQNLRRIQEFGKGWAEQYKKILESFESPTKLLTDRMEEMDRSLEPLRRNIAEQLLKINQSMKPLQDSLREIQDRFKNFL